MGITGQIYDWLSDYLPQRSQKTKVNGSASILQPITCGVPQGSVLGLLLFLISINELPDWVESDTMQMMYANDTVICVNGETRQCRE